MLLVSVQQSRSVFRKYCGALDIILSVVQQVFGSLQVCCINRQPYQAVQALQAHKSQYVWYGVEANIVSEKGQGRVQTGLMANSLAGIGNCSSDCPLSHIQIHCRSWNRSCYQLHGSINTDMYLSASWLGLPLHSCADIDRKSI